MDRQMVLAILVAVSASGVLGMFFFSSGPASDQPVYAPSDIRFTQQQDEARRKARQPKKVLDSSSNSEDQDSSESSENEAPPAEEPPIE